MVGSLANRGCNLKFFFFFLSPPLTLSHFFFDREVIEEKEDAVKKVGEKKKFGKMLQSALLARAGHCTAILKLLLLWVTLYLSLFLSLTLISMATHCSLG